MEAWRYTIPGEPMAWARARDAGPDGYANPARYQRWLEATGRRMRQSWVLGEPKRPPLNEPLLLRVGSFLYRPARRPQAYPPEAWKSEHSLAIGRADLDNYVAAVMDAATRAGIWVDDTRVSEIQAAKYWLPALDAQERTEVTVFVRRLP